jgi:hypothetical protein
VELAFLPAAMRRAQRPSGSRLQVPTAEPKRDAPALGLVQA